MEKTSEQRIEVIPLSKVRARDINPRTRFDGLDELAESFELNAVNPGEPVNPITVVADGGVYRVLDGERRYRAMKKAGKVKECHAIVFDGMDDAATILAMIATDEKERLSEGEMGRAYQTALMLGVPEDVIEKRAGKGSAAAIRRQMGRTGNKPVTMSIGQMLAADEFADDPEAYEAIVSADGGGWLAERNRRRTLRDRAAEAARVDIAVTAAQAAFGLRVEDKPPKGAILERTFWSGLAERIEDEGAEWAAEGCVLVRPRPTKYGGRTQWELYSVRPDLTPEQAAAAKSRSALRRSASKGRKRRIEWLGDRLSQFGAASVPNVRRFVAAQVRDSGAWMYDVNDFCKKAGVDATFLEDASGLAVGNEYVIANTWTKIDHLTNDEVDWIGSRIGSEAKRAAARHLALLGAMRKDGYEPDEDEEHLAGLCAEAGGSR